MKKIVIILYLSTSLFSCSIHSNVYNNTVNQQFVGEGTDSIEVGEEADEELVNYIQEFVKYNPLLKNECSNDNRLYVSFILSIDTIVNDTILIRNIEIEEIRDSNHEIVERKMCEESFLKQLREKIYLYKCKKIKRQRLKCFAIQ